MSTWLIQISEASLSLMAAKCKTFLGRTTSDADSSNDQ